MRNQKKIGILGVPSSLDNLLKGSIYAAILDSVPAHLSIIIQTLKANLSAGNTCVFVSQLSPHAFLSMTESSGVNFREDITHNRLHLFSQEGDYASNIFHYGIKRFLQEFDYFEVPKGCFYLFDQAEKLFTISDQNIAQTQAIEYRDWMESTENTSLFLFVSKAEQITQSILCCFNGVIRINQNKIGIELLVDFWYAQNSAIAAKKFPVLLDSTGLIRVVSSFPQPANPAYQADSGTDDRNTVFYFGHDFEYFSAFSLHKGVWIHAESFVDLVHLSRDAVRATIVISLASNSDLEKTTKIVNHLRLNRGNSLRIIVKESNFSLRYLNELLLLRFGANLIIHQQVSKQQLPLLWEMLAGQIYTRRVQQNFDLTLSSMLSSSHKGYVDLVTFCTESLCIFEKGDLLDIPLTLIVAGYHEQSYPPDILSQLKVTRNGDVFSSDSTHCYIFIHACAEENSAATLAHITEGKQAFLFINTRLITDKGKIKETLQLLVQSGNIALVPDFSKAIAQSSRSKTILNTGKNTYSTSPLSLSLETIPETESSSDDIKILTNWSSPQHPATERTGWTQK